MVARGFVQLHCDTCGHDVVVGLSCKGRGFCSRCGGRRMTETALHLTDHVIPRVRVRQWVLTVPHRYRYRIGYDHALCKRFLRALNRELRTYYRNKSGQPDGQTGSVTFIQRFNGELALSPHYHVIAIDGVFVEDAEHGLRFIEASEPSKLDVAEVLSAVHARIHGVLRRLGLEEPDEDSDPLASDSPALAACYSGSITRRTALGPNAGQAVVKLGALPNMPWVEIDKPRHAHYEGFDLHADVAFAADNRQGLEQLLRYGARPAIASGRLALTEDGRVSLELKRRYHDGTTHILFQPTTFIERLAALVPRPQKNLTIYSGVLAPNAKLRSKVVAFGAPAELPQPPAVTAPEPASAEPTQLPLAAATEPPVGGVQPAANDNTPKPERKRRRPNYTWAELMRHSFEIDVLECQRCGGRLRMLAAVTKPAAVRAALAKLGMPTEAPKLRPARPPPEQFESA
ncbi:MAG TPA: transposase [Polyangiales bacterium]